MEEIEVELPDEKVEQIEKYADKYDVDPSVVFSAIVEDGMDEVDRIAEEYDMTPGEVLVEHSPEDFD
ncbi:hypothetical protein [Natrinema versiforme]|uniref:Uncharacterized protein n=2 Tax=Natrinema versiforme TaxID=88724 RepID=L9XWT3_9EURY|nr:hypothetical protein [Natrinema versiforme]ELY66299.1 hypothetical protein C489_13096 [Natrinema versiforme JCM 10478]QCS44675.1 lytic transglycosylase domain-containing protein [Natrinema versiforme]